MTAFFHDLLIWIENNLHTNLKIENISIKSGYSKWHLQRMFHKYFGISLGRYIRNRKITNAALLIKMSQLPMVEICVESGFSSQQTFTRFFKKYYGVTPGYYRKTRFISSSFFQRNLAMSWNLTVKHENIIFEHNIVSSIHNRRNDFKEEQQEVVLSQRDESIESLFYKRLTRFILDLYEKPVISSCNESNYLTITAGFKKTLSVKDPVILFTAGDATLSSAVTYNEFIRFYYEGYISDLENFINYVYFNYMPENKIKRKDSDPDFFSGCFFEKENKGGLKGYYYIPLPDMCHLEDDK
ncbi:helix-turn-helix domain-containing protein [Kosakonia oryzae]|uniref:helix-turn-helix domain-containing protein n=1 Tax=Kosakonia oryzae TaxID=497725 RepID=UPI001D06EA4B|nr:helix-turn-helix domain-containing protein [Kosakonia oryzae]UDJ84288.1 helix-turn-helix domain-containing protein [Kosakonia oryzae]